MKSKDVIISTDADGIVRVGEQNANFKVSVMALHEKMMRATQSTQSCAGYQCKGKRKDIGNNKSDDQAYLRVPFRAEFRQFSVEFFFTRKRDQQS